MLLQFNFKNFKSFRDDTTLDLSATKISEYSNHTVKIGNEKILPIAAIFGANAYGKSNVVEAFRYMHYYVIHSFNYGGDSNDKEPDKDFRPPTPFLFDSESKKEVSSFEIYFIDSEEAGAKTYNYGFTVNSNGINEEWLNYKAKTARKSFTRIFYRNICENVLDLPGIALKSRENIKVALEPETLIVSLGSKLKISKLKHIRDWFLANEFADFGEPAETFFLSTRLTKEFVESVEVQNKVVNYFSAFDDSIKGFRINSIINNDGKRAYKIEAVHKMIDSDDEALIPLRDESSGTLKMLSLYPMLQKVLDTGATFIIDELNARLHPLLIRTFIITFLNPEINVKHAQLVFTSHDSWQLIGNSLRRDEIWFTDKDSNGVSSLYSLADFMSDEGTKIRKDENYAKNYLLGKYGAIPSMKYFDMFKEE
jgi:AAA15 family ATPase/GTPase